MTIPKDTQLGRYKIESQLGEGGMGEVYLAHDTQLDRAVAIKILPAEIAATPQRLGRFLQEARTASKLKSANVAHIYEIGQWNDLHYIAMEYVDGETLSEKINGQPLPATEIIRIGIKIAKALDEAHSKGITHRDIKPQNVMITSDGEVKVLDFGLAKVAMNPAESAESAPNSELATQVMTSPGVVMGTVNYMSPEQALGREVDSRTDIFSLGVVLYEMSTGRVPFSGGSPTETIDKITRSQPEAIARFNYGLPPELEMVVKKALRKKSDERYQTAKEMLIDLRTLQRELEIASHLEHSALPISSSRMVGDISSERATAMPANDLPLPVKTDGHAAPRTSSSAEYLVSEIRQHKLVALIVLAAVIIAGAGIYFYFARSRKMPITSIAILPLVNVSGDPDTEYLSDGITESVINNLLQLSALRVMARSTVFRYKGRETDPQTIGRELGVDAVLTGRLIQRGDTLVVQADLVNVADGSQLWGEQFNRKLSDMMAVQEDISREIAEKLRLRISSDEQKHLTRRYTDNVEAYQLYLKGRYHHYKLSPPEIRKGVEFFQQAIAVDPTYALAYAGLAEGYRALCITGEVPPMDALPKAKAAAAKALEIDESLGDAHATLGFIKLWFDWDWLGAEKECKRAIELNPNSPDGHRAYASLLSDLGRHQEALLEAQRAREADPLSLIDNTLEGAFLYFAGRNEEAIRRLQQTLELGPNFWIAHLFLGRIYIQKGMYPEAIAELTKAREFSGGNSQTTSLIGYSSALSGNRAQALAILDELKSLSATRYVPPYNIAIVYNGLGDKDQAFAWLGKACEQRDLQLTFIKVDPVWDSFRADSRVTPLMRCVGLP